MEVLISTFHVEWKLLIAQAINFGIVFAILWWVALKPLLRIMADREQRISKSLEDANELEKRLKASDEAYEQKLQEARNHAIQILEEADLAAEQKVKEAVLRARRETELVVSQAREQIEEQRRRVVEEAKQDLAGIIMSAVEKVIEQKLDAKRDRALIDDALTLVSDVSPRS